MMAQYVKFVLLSTTTVAVLCVTVFWSLNGGLSILSPSSCSTKSNEKATISNDGGYDSHRYCNLSDATRPTPVILLSSGRSGSGSTWQILTNLTGKQVPSDEYTGSNPPESAEFWKQHTTFEWLEEILCRKQDEEPDAEVVGIKWKPHSLHLMWSKGSVAALEYVRDTQNVKVIRNRRNPLDVYISTIKHNITAWGKVKAHCKESYTQKQKENCLAKHLLVGTNMTLDTSEVGDYVLRWKEMEDGTDRMLETLGVPHVKVTYEKLYYDDGASEWEKLFQYVGKGPRNGLKMTEIRSSMEHIPTHNDDHRVTLANYKKVRKALKKVGLKYLLH